MANLKRVFVWRTGHDMGDGWIMKGMDHFDPGEGLTIAHDTLEHFDKGLEFSDELQAFGHILWGRALGGYRHFLPFTPRYTEAENMLDDLARFLCEENMVVPPSRAKPLGDDDGYEPELILAEIAEKLPKAVVDEYEGRHGFGPDSEYETEAALRETLAIRIPDLLGWMRIGYRRAARRWKHTNREQFVQLFWDLQQRVEQLRPEYSDQFDELDELHVSVDMQRMDFKLRVKYYQDPYA